MRIYLSFKKRCPKCKGTELTRIPRHKWMRYIPHSKLYECNFCRADVLVLKKSHADEPYK
jgi:uncharacterized protein with PIN domain